MRKLWERIWPVLKWLVPAVILAFVGWHFAKILDRSEWSAARFDLGLGWLLLSGGLYLTSHTIWASFWSDLLRAQSVDVPRGLGVRTYFVSQLGKYVPGKAWVILLRMAMLRRHSERKGAIALAATYETLTTMAAGSLVGLLLLPWLGERAALFADKEWMLIALVGLPMCVGVAQRLLGKRAKKTADTTVRPKFRLTLLLRGLLQASVGWVLMGLSLWACLRGLTPSVESLTLDVALRFTAMSALAYVIGFAALVVPGGVGVREWLILSMLTVELAGTDQPAALAAVAALTLRLVWTASELLVIAGIYVAKFRYSDGSNSPRPEDVHA